MKQIKRGICLLLAVLLVVGFAACGKKEGGTDPQDPEAGDADGKRETRTPESAFGGIDNKTVMLEIEGDPVYWEEIYYYLTSIRFSFENYYTVDDWDAVFEENDIYEETLTYNEFALRFALESARERRAVDRAFEEQGDALDAETYLDTKEDFMEYYDFDEAEYLDFLVSNNTTEDFFDYINENMAKYYQLFDTLYGKDGVDVPGEEIAAFVESNGIVRAKHILLKTVDDTNAPLPEEEIAAAKAQADEIHGQLSDLSGDALLEKFDALSEAYNEDPGMLYYPEGYTYEPGTMMPAFEESASGLEVGAVSGPVETDYGYHVILRLEVQGDQPLYSSSSPLHFLVASERISSVLNGVKDTMAVTETAAMKAIVPSDIFAVIDAAAAEKAGAEDRTDGTADADPDAKDGTDGKTDADPDAESDGDADPAQ